MTIPTLTTLPVAPARTDPPATFVTRADAFLAAIVTFQGEMNTSIGAMNTDIAQVNTDATAAAASASAAASSATAAANAAGAALWVSGQAYAEGDAAISGVDYQTYRAETATSGTTDPSADANWTKISGVLPAESGNAGKFLTTDGSTASWAAIETGTLTATASGALTDGCPVVVNSSGSVSKTFRAQQTEATGSATDVFDNSIGDNDYISSCYVPDTGDIWFCYADNSTVPIFRRISVTGTSISSGAANNQVPSQGTGGEGRYPQICYIGNSKVAIVFSANNDGNAGLCVIATVAGNGTATFGTPVEFVSNSVAMSVCYDSDNDKIVVVYRDDSNSSFGKAVIGTVSGTSVTFGTPIAFQNGLKPQTKFDLKAIYIPEQELIVCMYRSALNGAQAYLESFSSNGTTLTNVDQVLVFADQPEYFDMAYAPDKTELMVVWTAQSDSDNGKAKNYNFSGGATNKNFSNIDFDEWTNGSVNSVVLTYDPDASHWYMVYQNLSQSSYPYRRYVKTSALGIISTDNEAVLYSSGSGRNGMTYDPEENSHCFIGYENAAAHKIGYDVTNLTTTNYIGISNGAYADGETATVQIIGAVDDAQTGLTAGGSAYVQRNGTIGTSADSPSVIAGTAVSATEIIVKG